MAKSDSSHKRRKVDIMPEKETFVKRKADVMAEIYAKEGDDMLEQKKYRAAIELFSVALKCNPSDIGTLVKRSKCYMQQLQVRKATDDIDNALHLNHLHKEALLQKGEILFQTQNYELALVYFTRGSKQYPKSMAFQEGIGKTEQLVGRGKKNKGKKMKLTEAGDLSFLVHKHPAPKPFKFESKAKTSQRLPKPSASFKNRTQCQLIRIHKTPAIHLQRALSPGSMEMDSTSSNENISQDKRPESKAVKTKVKEFYEDKKYFEKLKDNDKFPAVSTLGNPIHSSAEDGISFIYDRYKYWDRLGPLPPPHEIKRSNANRLSASLTSLDSIATHRTYGTKASQKSESNWSWKNKANVKSRLGLGDIIKVHKPKVNPVKIDFKFTSHLNTSENGTENLPEIAEEDEDAASAEGSEDELATKSQLIIDFVTKEVYVIQTEYKYGRMSEVVKKCSNCLKVLKQFEDFNLIELHESKGLVYSYLGNVALHRGDYAEAVQHHSVDLDIGETYDIKKCKFRALGNLGKVHMLQKKYNRALEMFTMKAPLCKTAAESSALFHDIGNCFLLLSSATYARDAARKSLETAKEADDQRLQLQAHILIGLTEVNMKKYKDAHESFESAQSLAQSLGDKQAEQDIKEALMDINSKLAKKKSKENEKASKKTKPQNEVLVES